MDGRTDRRTDGRTNRRTDTEGYNIIPRHTLVAGYKNYNYGGLIVKVLLTLGLHAVFIEFCKIYG